MIIKFRDMQRTESADVIALWQACNLTRPWNNPHTDIDFALSSPTSTILLGHAQHELVSSVMVGHDGHRGVFYYLAVAPAHQGKGFGRHTVTEAENWLRRHGVWKINLLVREENAAASAFYKALGYDPNPVLSFGKRLVSGIK